MKILEEINIISVVQTEGKYFTHHCGNILPSEGHRVENCNWLIGPIIIFGLANEMK